MSKGRVWKYGDNVNTDVLYPGRYTYQILPPEEMAKHALEDLDPEFAANVRPGDVIVAGKNFGCGSWNWKTSTTSSTPEALASGDAGARHAPPRNCNPEFPNSR